KAYSFLSSLFPVAIWSEISLFVPEELFRLCQELQLPYHYVLFINTCLYTERWLFDFPHDLSKYTKLRHLETSSYLPIKLPINLLTIKIDNFNDSLQSLTHTGGCLNLRSIEINSFRAGWKGGLEPLSICTNLQIIKMNSFDGSLVPLGHCQEIQIIEMNRFNGDLGPLRACTKLLEIQMNSFNGNLDPLKGCFNLRMIKMW